jgi:hypothetical protein
LASSRLSPSLAPYQGTPGSQQTIHFTVPSGITLGAIAALTQGAPNLDYTVTGGTCAKGTTNTACTVQVQFLPKLPNQRLGALVLTDNITPPNLLISVPLNGTGTGPMLAFEPGIITSIAGTTSAYVIAVDDRAHLRHRASHSRRRPDRLRPPLFANQQCVVIH